MYQGVTRACLHALPAQKTGKEKWTQRLQGGGHTLMGRVYTQTWTQHSHAEESIPATQNWHNLPDLGEKAQPHEPRDVIKRIEGEREGQEKEEDKEMKEGKGDEEACEGGKTEGALTQP